MGTPERQEPRWELQKDRSQDGNSRKTRLKQTFRQPCCVVSIVTYWGKSLVKTHIYPECLGHLLCRWSYSAGQNGGRVLWGYRARAKTPVARDVGQASSSKIHNRDYLVVIMGGLWGQRHGFKSWVCYLLTERFWGFLFTVSMSQVPRLDIG